jgi:hypothetical protein
MRMPLISSTKYTGIKFSSTKYTRIKLVKSFPEVSSALLTMGVPAQNDWNFKVFKSLKPVVN